MTHRTDTDCPRCKNRRNRRRRLDPDQVEALITVAYETRRKAMRAEPSPVRMFVPQRSTDNLLVGTASPITPILIQGRSCVATAPAGFAISVGRATLSAPIGKIVRTGKALR